MVTRSIDNYQQHKIDIYRTITRHNPARAKKFIDYYSERYDPFGRSFLDWRLCYKLMDEIYELNNVGTKWFACVGPGGRGKSTFMKNLFYFLCPKFNEEGVVQNGWYGFFKNLKRWPKVDSYNGQFLDEPDNSISANSKEFNAVRMVFGQARQQKCYLGICATRLKDIQPFMWDRMDSVFLIHRKGYGIYVKNSDKKAIHPTQVLRDNIKGYDAFFELMKKNQGMPFSTIEVTPFDNSSEQYLKQKEQYYSDCIDNVLSLLKPKQAKNSNKLPDREKIMLELAKDKVPHHKIGDYVGLTRVRVTQILTKLRENDIIP